MLVEEKQVDAIRPKQHFHFCEWRFEKKMAQFFVLAVQRLLQSGLIHFEQIWCKNPKEKTIFIIPFVNVKTFYTNIFWLVRNPIWSSLIHFLTDLIQKKIKSCLSWLSKDYYSQVFYKLDMMYIELLNASRIQLE